MDTLENMATAYKSRRGTYGFFDCNCWFPFSDRQAFHAIDGIQGIAGEMANYGIGRGVVTNAESIEYDPSTGNRHLFERIDRYDNLYGAVVITPEMSFAGSVQKYLDRAIENGAAIVRMFPRTFRHSMKTWQVGDMLNSMQERHIPLMLWHTQVDWDAVQEICNDYNRLPVIIEGNDQKLLYHNRAYLPLMQHYDNLYMETHSLIQFGEIEHLVNEFGIHRLLFGSYMPYNTPDASMMTITHAGIDEETKHLIAHGNIERLIEAIIS